MVLYRRFFLIGLGEGFSFFVYYFFIIFRGSVWRKIFCLCVDRGLATLGLSVESPFFLISKFLVGIFWVELNRLFLKEGLVSELLSERDVAYGLDWWW